MRDKRLQQLEADNYQEEQAAEDEAYSESDVRSSHFSACSEMLSSQHSSYSPFSLPVSPV